MYVATSLATARGYLPEKELAWLRGWKQSHDLCAYPEYNYDRS